MATRVRWSGGESGSVSGGVRMGVSSHIDTNVILDIMSNMTTHHRPRVLRAPEEHPESHLPAQIQRLARPRPLLKAQALAFLRFERPRLDAAERFLTDFGMQVVSRSSQSLVMRGSGPASAIYVATQGRKARYVGAAFVVPAGTDFAPLIAEAGAVALPPTAIPGGGRGVSLVDPAGNEVWLITDWAPQSPLPQRAATHEAANQPGQTRRVNQTVRTPIAPAAVARLGHVVMQTVDFHAMANWYMRYLGLIPSDVQYLADGSPALCFFRLDLGAQPADHHTVVIAGGLENKYEHSAYEVLDIDALGQGQQVLRANGHQHLWGIGRHVLGSQLFDYWLDPDGFEFEHYTDGDVFTADHETHYVPFELGYLWAWGADVPPDLVPKKSLGTAIKALMLLKRGLLNWRRLQLLDRVTATRPRPWL